MTWPERCGDGAFLALAIFKIAASISESLTPELGCAILPCPQLESGWRIAIIVKSSGNPTWLLAVTVLIAGTVLLGIALKARSEDTKTNSVAVVGTNSVAVQAPPARHELSGAELYSMHCNRCHPERYPTERTAAQWKTILMHMRVRANLPAEHARTILKYLQENSGR